MRQKLTYILLLATFVCYGATTKVTRVIDGDTFETETGEKVRLIGINAPEITDIFGQEAKQYLSELIENRIVDLQSDIISNDRDRYQRLLRYVIIDGVDVNKKMVSDGYAFAYLKYKFSKSYDYEQAQLQARENSNGIWGNSNKEDYINKEEIKETPIWEYVTPKAYLVSTLVLIILIFGILFYFKK